MLAEPVGPVPAGVYRHWKGQLYLLLGLAHDADVEGREAVVYVGLYTDPDKPGPRLSVRTRSAFFGAVDTPDGPVPRFAYVGATWSPTGERAREPGAAPD